MINYTPDGCQRIHEIYEMSIKSRDSSGAFSNYDPLDILDLNKLISTISVGVPGLVDNVFYWKFLSSWIDYMKTGVWLTDPRMWYEVLIAAKNVEIVQEGYILANYELYYKKREELCKHFGIGSGPSSDAELKYIWLTKKDGMESFITVPHTLMRVFVSTHHLQINGLRVSDDPEGDNSFNAADQSIWPVAGYTKVQTLISSLSGKVSRHKQFL